MYRRLLTRFRPTRPGRGSGLPRRRLGLAGGLVLGGVVLGGLAEVLLAMTAAVLALDALVPMPGGTRSAADDRFRRLVRERRRARLAGRLRGSGPERLDLLDDRSGWAATAPRRELGIQAIDVRSVTATVEPLKARSFDRDLRPDAASREQWKRIWMAHAGGAPLPPVSVYRVGGEHVLRDGHHRVSVARELGLERIDADVVELHGPPRC
jgi:hypothetical protein